MGLFPMCTNLFRETWIYGRRESELSISDRDRRNYYPDCRDQSDASSTGFKPFEKQIGDTLLESFRNITAEKQYMTNSIIPETEKILSRTQKLSEKLAPIMAE